MKILHDGGNYNFHYAAMITSWNITARQWLSNHYNYYWVPTCYWDGGDEVLVGGTLDTAAYTYRIDNSNQREVPDLDLDVSLTWLGNFQIEVTVTVTNNTFSNSAPSGPVAPSGPTAGLVEDEHTFSAGTTDPDGDDLYYMWDWGDGQSGWLGPYISGETVEGHHTWSAEGEFNVSVKVKDSYDQESAWSGVSSINILARGNADGDSIIDVGDAVFMIGYIFRDGPAPEPLSAGDANCDDKSDVGDAVFLIQYIFRDGPPPGCL